jgi:hypothetical protein
MSTSVLSLFPDFLFSIKKRRKEKGKEKEEVGGNN